MSTIKDYFFCPECGARNDMGVNACIDCGHVFKQEQPLTSGPSEPTQLPGPAISPGAKLAIGAFIAAIVIIAGVVVWKKEHNKHMLMIASESTEDKSDEGDGVPNDADNKEVSEVDAQKAEDTVAESIVAEPQLLINFNGEIRYDDQEKRLVNIEGTIRDNYGNYYTNGIGGQMTNVDNSSEFRLAGKYKWFFGRVVLAFDFRTDYHEDTFLYIYGDGRELYKSKQVRNGVELQDIQLDVTGIDWLRIQIRGCNDIRLVDAGVSNVNDSRQFSTMIKYTNRREYSPVAINELEFYNGSSANKGINILTDTVRDNYGNTYTGGLAGMNSGVPNWVIYDISDCGYTRISGRVVLNAEFSQAQSTDTFVKIYTDGSNTPTYTSSLVTMGMKPEDFSVDISDASDLKIEIQGSNYIRVVNCQLSR